ncbi:hypothetical protein [Rhodobacter sp. SY28-1]|uniref:hypothetical protein n=1 Tax=Rhodobacter sp. SY28-1 TaxID=2562317 RepID=UPI001485A6B4|nr:hypothetical protein [Rhodobacter sp. SY28-1]
MDWTNGNKAGRAEAAKAIEAARETGDLPALVEAIKQAASSNDARSVGFLYQVAGCLTA